ncbi:MAG: sulfite exporter TauE/SafE family protein [Pseudomonadota bacterium]
MPFSSSFEYGLLLLALAAAGGVSGFAAGLFGVGGGIVTVPALYAVLQATGSNDEISLKTAIGTSLAIIIVTSTQSLRAHHQAGFVDMSVLRGWVLWIAIGSLIGASTVRWISGEFLGVIFALGAIIIAARRLRPSLNKNAKPVNIHDNRIKIPLGLGTGAFSSLLGLGGGAVGVMVMKWAGRSIHQAIGTSAGFGVAVAGPGMAGFVAAGWGAPELAPFSTGYVNLIAFAVMAGAAALTAPMGARFAHAAAPEILSRIFSGYVFLVAVGLLFDIFR